MPHDVGLREHAVSWGPGPNQLVSALFICNGLKEHYVLASGCAESKTR